MNPIILIIIVGILVWLHGYSRGQAAARGALRDFVQNLLGRKGE